VAQRVIDVLEAVEVETEHGQALALLRAIERPLHALAQQGAVGQLGQKVVVRHVRHARLDAPVLGHVLVRGEPASIRHRLMLDGDDAPVAELADLGHRPALGDDLAQLARIVLGQLPGLQTLVDAMLNYVGKRRARLGQLGRQAVHPSIGCIANDQPMSAIVHAKALRHVVEGRIEAQVLHLQLEFL
jgi:hypothetical protein